MTGGHIHIIFTMTMLGVHIFHYYSSNSITSNYIVFTGVKNFCLQSVVHARASVWSGRPQSADVCLVVQTCSFDTCVCELDVHIFHYYSSNSITSNYIVFTGVKNFCLQSVAHARASVWSGRPQSADVSLVVHWRTDMQLRHVRCGVCVFSHIFSVFAVWTLLHCLI